ncbi:unnamed protein product [Trifolium pratense]|uniref:Uncharacterized protein n=1 Tax=Trifolium pratense TaxID=57577 RepID=A0ACB0KWQ3_TRIPR|nr:unnamed protein product [Trifolium pratense]
MTKRRAGAAVYNRASSLETLVGYLYLTKCESTGKANVRIGILSRLFNAFEFGGINRITKFEVRNTNGVQWEFLLSVH